jgi:hypothetical protein
MRTADWLSTTDLRAIFEAEIAALGGRVSDLHIDGERLYARSVLPGIAEVAPKDRLQGGVALRGDDEEIAIHPYVFRQICTNGAIRAHATQTVRFSRADADEIGDAFRDEVRCALRACADPSAFREGADEMRSARDVSADFFVSVLPYLSRMGPNVAASILVSLRRAFDVGRDASRFGLMNAITAVARDARDPEVRWRLEELGGGIPLAPDRPAPTLDPVREEAFVLA